MTNNTRGAKRRGVAGAPTATISAHDYARPGPRGQEVLAVVHQLPRQAHQCPVAGIARDPQVDRRRCRKRRDRVPDRCAEHELEEIPAERSRHALGGLP
jgi:hypothetical protein